MKLKNWINIWSISQKTATRDEISTSRLDAKRDIFVCATLFGREVIFTSNLIDRSTVPRGMRVYEVRPDENGNPTELSHSFSGAKYGTIITHAYIPMKDGYRKIKKSDLRLKNEEISLCGFMEIYPPKKRTQQLFGA